MKIPDSKQIMRDGENIIGMTTNLILEEEESSQRTVISKENLENVLNEPEPSKQEAKGIMIAPRIEE